MNEGIGKATRDGCGREVELSGVANWAPNAKAEGVETDVNRLEASTLRVNKAKKKTIVNMQILPC